MSIAQFTVADDVINDFNQLFHKDQQNQVIEKLIRQIISEAKQQHQRQQAFYSLMNRRVLRPAVSQNEIEQIRGEVRL